MLARKAQGRGEPGLPDAPQHLALQALGSHSRFCNSMGKKASVGLDRERPTLAPHAALCGAQGCWLCIGQVCGGPEAFGGEGAGPSLPCLNRHCEPFAHEGARPPPPPPAA